MSRTLPLTFARQSQQEPCLLQKMKRTFEDIYLSSDEELEEALVQAMDHEEEGPLDEYFDENDEGWEHAMVRSLDRSEQFGGALGPLFRFRMEPAGRRRQWRNIVDHTQFHAVLEQGREARTSDNLGVHLMEALYKAIKDQFTPDARPQDLLHFAIHAHGFTHAFRSSNIQVGDFLRRDSYTDELLDTLAGKLNSNEDFHPDRGLQVDVVLIRMPTPGSGRARKKQVGFRAWEDDSKRKQSIIRIENQDDLCCARAIVTMRAWCHRNDPGHMPRSDWNALRLGRPRQKQMAQELHRAAGVPEGPCGYPELEQFQQYLSTLNPPYQLKVMNRQKPFFISFKGPDAPHIIQLLKSDNHFEGCTSFKGFMDRSYWCHLCDKGFDHNNAAEHSCEGRTCRACDRPNNTCPDYDRFSTACLPCHRCHFKFYGEQCLAHHQASKKCGKFMKCLTCHAGYKVDKKHPHRCYKADCYSCGLEVYIADHRCYIQPPFEPPPPQQRNAQGQTTAEEVPPPKLIYADIECWLTADRGFHPNLLCYRGEWQSDITVIHPNDCDEDDENVVDRFLLHLDDYAHPADENIEEQPLIIIFHNLKGFDGIFILNSLYKNMRTVEEQLTIGAKVLSFQSGPLTFKDSLCFLPMPLSSFPSTFGLTELKKGFFPHAFNIPSNQDYRGSIPPLADYDPDGMSPDKKEELKTWHADQVQRNVVFDFQQELVDYCKSDVDILQGGCEKFCEEFQRKAGFNPFVECVTIASACNRYWRKHHLEDKTIAVEPPQGWRGARVNQSWVALQWLTYQQSLLPPNARIQHVRNGGEKKVPTEKGEEFVDGFDPSTNTVYEFLGCLWHGCPTCCNHQRHKTYGANPDRSLYELYEATEAKMQRLERAGYQIKIQWECQWNAQVKRDPSLSSFLSSLTSTPPLQPRDAFFGGRTGAVALYHKADPGEKIFYVDVTSLYPWVNKTKRYPLGHPEIHFEPENQNLDDYFGIALVTIRPPRHLFHPVLPVRHGGKLTFPLCMQCVREEQPKPLFDRSATCRHTDQQRQLQGTWCTPEIQEARARGYILVRIHEVWHFNKTRVGLFADYVNTWLQIKQESAGWPRWCQTDAQKQQYLQQYREKEGITLQNVAKNPGRKQVAKLMLNSFWGKFGERTNKPKTEQVKQPAQLYRLLTDAANQVQTLRVCTDEVLEVVYTQTEDNDLPSAKTNIFIACFTTCWARLKLYSYLHRLQKQVLYYDTDSVIYAWRPGQPPIETGDYLGDMTDELDGDTIKTFVSGGAKNYAYKTVGGKYCCKVRGFTLNVRGREKLNYRSMKQHIKATLEDEEPADTITVRNPNHFSRDQTLKKLKLTTQDKNYRLVFDKRVIDLNTKRSHPFGYF